MVVAATLERVVARRLPAWVASLAALACLPAHAALQVVVVQGIGGESVYEDEFGAQARAIGEAARGLTDRVQVLSGDQATRSGVQALFRQLAGSLAAEDRIALYSSSAMAASTARNTSSMCVWRGSQRPRPCRHAQCAAGARSAVVATGSSSGALQESLKRDARIVLTATRSGNERNATRFGGEFVAALSDPGGDPDKNGSVSAQEATSRNAASRSSTSATCVLRPSTRCSMENALRALPWRAPVARALLRPAERARRRR